MPNEPNETIVADQLRELQDWQNSLMYPSQENASSETNAGRIVKLLSEKKLHLQKIEQQQ